MTARRTAPSHLDSIAAMSSANFRMVRLAREMRSMTQTQLARESGVPQAILSRIEANIRSTTDVELEQLAATMGLPVSFFLEPDSPAAAPLFRKRALRSASAYRTIQARINAAVLVARRILDAGIDIDTPLTFPAPRELPRDHPGDASRILRRAWQLPNGRVDSVTEVIERAGGIVLHVDFGTDDAGAAFISTLGDPRLWFLVNTRETAGDRVRLSLAHELGHAVMHRFLPVLDENTLEPAAYEFAVAFTLPPEDFNPTIGSDLTLRRARDLKRAYWISIQAIVKTARDRAIISPHRYTSLYKQISARGWRRDEPDPIPIEQPAIWPSALQVHRQRHNYGDEELASIARVTVHDLSQLFPRDFGPRLRVIGGNQPAQGTEPPTTCRRLSSV
jgi:Zn-dependent peptidase ImmA (M78 family)/DNA-binding XRE family transcriptional regulator